MAVDTVLGSRQRRVDSEDKITGACRFTADLHLPGILHGRLLLSPYAHARIGRIDASAALAVPGVVAVVSHRDLGELLKGTPNSRARAMLADDRARFCGQPVAAVLAESEAAASGSSSTTLPPNPPPTGIGTTLTFASGRPSVSATSLRA